MHLIKLLTNIIKIDSKKTEAERFGNLKPKVLGGWG